MRCLPLVLLAGCFPELPDERLVDDLRVLAIAADPDPRVVDGLSPLTVELEALAVAPDDIDGGSFTHRWTLELGDEEFEGREALEALVPREPHGPRLSLDFSALFAARETGWTTIALPLRYFVTDGATTRDAVKLARVLVPEIPEDGTPPKPGDPTLDDDYNRTPTLTGLRVDAGGLLTPSRQAPLRLPALEPGQLVEITVEIDDDDPDSVERLLFWTAGDPGRPLETPDFGPPGGSLFGGSNARTDGVLVVSEDPTVFAWTAPDDLTSAPRLWVVLRDDAGGQTWQEIRFEDAR